MHVAQSSTPPSCHHHTLSLFHKVRDYFIAVCITYNGAAGYRQHNILALCSMHFLTNTRLACPGLKMMAVAIIYQRIQIGGSFQVYTPPSASITPIWPTQWSEFFASEMTRTVAA